jgi:hypothetical protein
LNIFQAIMNAVKVSLGFRVKLMFCMASNFPRV